MKMMPSFALVTISLAALILASCHTNVNTAGSCGDGIVGGTVVNEDDFWAQKVVMVVSGSADREDGELCTGTLIRRNVILTAAHCVTGATTSVAIFSPEPVCDKGLNSDATMIHSTRIIAHPDYKNPGDDSDLALIELQENAPATYPTIRIYNGETERSSETVTFAGYGLATENDTQKPRLRRMSKVYGQHVALNGKKLWVDQRDGRGVCQGDSGGPVFFEVKNQPQVAAVNSFVSRPRDVGADKACHYGSAAIYLPAFSDWIQKSLASLTPQTSARGSKATK